MRRSARSISPTPLWPVTMPNHDGAGIYNGGTGTITITSSTITDNFTEAAGGGIYAVGGTITITDSTISDNTAHDGGGLYSDGASDINGLRSRVTITGSTIKDNLVEAGGGGINNGGDAHLDHHRFHHFEQQSRRFRRRSRQLRASQHDPDPCHLLRQHHAAAKAVAPGPALSA